MSSVALCLLLCLAVWLPVVTSDPTNTADTTPFFTAEQQALYDERGYLIVSPSMFSEADLQGLMEAGNALVTAAATMKTPQFSVIAQGVMFENSEHQNATDATGTGDDADSDSDESSSCSATNTTSNAFRQIAVHSVLGQACAQLLQLDANKGDNLRILRDVFLAKPVHASTECDWHVDDQFFWPESFCNGTTDSGVDTACADGEASDRGVNVWIAMDDMPLDMQGSMALAPGSHKADWRHDAYRAIGQDRSIAGGVASRDAFFSGFTKNGTCDMPKNDPVLRQQIEDNADFLDMKKGDVIFANRLLFHRTTAVTDNGKATLDAVAQTNLNRYSVRYVPGTARLPTGYSFEWSMFHDPANGGRALDDVVKVSGQEWYPQVWPTVDSDVDAKLHDLGAGDMKFAIEKKEAEMGALFADMRAAREAQAEEQQPPAVTADA
jgi:ectoine hydroxylase-related dioxygenase (phytanoyl-CoA dioxygenase family)